MNVLSNSNQYNEEDIEYFNKRYAYIEEAYNKPIKELESKLEKIEVELEKEDSHIAYEVEILGEDGIVSEIYINARTKSLHLLRRIFILEHFVS